MDEPIRRYAGRLLLLDPAGRVLLIHEREYDGPGSYWLTPGGGVEPGESAAEAAVRETREETGFELSLPAGSNPVHADRRLWSFGGHNYDQSNDFFAVRVSAGLDPVPHALTELERQTLIGFRWWSLPELRASGDLFYPEDLPDLVERVHRRLPGAE